MILCKLRSFAVGLVAILSLFFGPLKAEQITLNSLDGTVSMTGELLEYDGITYLLGMLVGQISLDASQVICVGAACPNQSANVTDFSISGSGSIGDTLLPTLIEVFALDRGNELEVSTNTDGSQQYNIIEADGSVFASITVQPTGSRNGFSDLLEGSAIIGMSSRRISTDEISAFNIAGKGQMDTPSHERILAMDGVIAAVNAENPVKILSFSQIAAIFEGQITNWNMVGGMDAPINLYRSNDSADMIEAVFTAAEAVGTHEFSQAASVLESNGAVSDAVADDVNGIGLTSYAHERNAQAVTIRSVCGGLFEPTEFAIKTESYPLAQRMYLYTPEAGLPDAAAEFLSYVTSSAAQPVIRNMGFIDQSALTADLDAQGRRLAQAIVSSTGRTELLQLQDLTSIMLDAEQLSFTLHYDANGTLDARAQADIQRLAEMIKTGMFTSRQMLVLGFSENTGAVNAQLVATQSIAQNVRDLIVAATGRANLGNLRISPIGYGRLMPLGCNETANGRNKNNRVEIWVK